VSSGGSSSGVSQTAASSTGAGSSSGQSTTRETSGSSSGGTAAGGFSLGGCAIFPASYAYNQDISQAAIDPNSASYLTDLQANAPVIGLDYPGNEIYNLVPATQGEVPVGVQSAYGFDATNAFFFSTGVDGGDAAGITAPIPGGVMYENMTTPNADHHLMVLEQGTCTLFELYAWNPTSATTGWEAMVTWNLAYSPQIPDADELGSTTAAGTPLLPGVIWPDEVAAGAIEHALDIVMPSNAVAKCKYVHPASDGSWGSTGTFPYGGRFRLKAGYDTSGFTGTQALVVIRALQTYGMFNTDISGETRSSFRLGGLGSSQGWDQADISQLGQLTWADFDVVDLGTVLTMKGCN
jgi:hypothetical protein